MATTAATLVVKVIADTKQATAGLDSTAKATSSWKDKLGGASKVATAGLLALGGAAIFAGKAAAEDAQGQAVLANTLKNSAGATSDQVAATEAWIAKMAMATGVADDDLRPALGNLVRATGDVGKSQKAMAIALDISAATGKDVSAVTAAMAKGYGGNEKALNKLLPSVTKVSEKTGDFDAVMKAAAKTTGGAAAASAETAAGQMQVMSVAMDEATESLGAALLPAMSMFAKLLAKAAGFMQKHTKAAQILIAAFAIFAASIIALNYAIKAYTVITTISTALTKRDAEGKLASRTATLAMGAAQKIATAAQWAWNAAISANPIGLVVIAVIALVAIMVVLYKKSATFRRFVDAMWKAIQAAAAATGKVLKAVWKAALAAVMGYVRGFVAYFKLVFGVLKGIVSLFIAIFKGDWRGVVDVVKGIIGGFRDFFRNIFDALPDPVQKVIDKIHDGLAGAFQFVKDKARPILDGIKSVFDGIEDAIQTVIDAVESLVGWIGNIKFPSPPGWLSKIPGLSSVLSVAKPSAASPNVGRFGAPRVSARGSARAGGGGGVTVNVNGALDPEAVARQIQRILSGHNRRVGLGAA